MLKDTKITQYLYFIDSLSHYRFCNLGTEVSEQDFQIPPKLVNTCYKDLAKILHM